MVEAREYLRIYAGVQYHLLYNFYPPAKASFVNPAVNAVLACLEGEIDRLIETPSGLVEAQELIKLFRLDFYLEEEEV